MNPSLRQILTHVLLAIGLSLFGVVLILGLDFFEFGCGGGGLSGVGRLNLLVECRIACTPCWIQRGRLVE